MPQWLEKAKHEAEYKDVTTVCLIPARTNTSWWHKICLKSAEIRFVLGRPKFGDASHGLPFPLAIVIFSPNTKACKVGTYDWKKKKNIPVIQTPTKNVPAVEYPPNDGSFLHML